MKKFLIVLLSLILTAGLGACGGPSDEEIKAVRSVSFEGTELTVTLGANKSTGYEWDYEIYGECVEPSAGRSFKITGSKGDATGEESTGFTGVSAGSAVIVFSTPYGWDGTGAGDSYTVNIVVGADGTIEKANGMDGAFPAAVSAAPAPGSTPAPTPEPTPAPTSEPTPEPTPKTLIAIAELRAGTYTGMMSGGEYGNDTETVFTTIMPADITVTIENGQITVFCEAITSAYGMLNGVKTPQSPEGSLILSGSLPLQQSGDAVTAEGELTSTGKNVKLYHNDMKFDRWELTERSGKSKYPCTVHIAMKDGAPVAAVVVDLKGQLSLTATVTLALAMVTEDAGSTELLSAPYAAMLKGGNYQYRYPLTYQGVDFIVTIAEKPGMSCRKVVSADGTFSQRVLSKDGKGYEIDDMTGTVKELGAEGYETPPDYANTLTFVSAKTLETGAVAEAYDFADQGKPCNVVFVFSEGKLVEFVTTIDGKTGETFVTDMTGAPDAALFDFPQ